MLATVCLEWLCLCSINYQIWIFDYYVILLIMLLKFNERLLYILSRLSILLHSVSKVCSDVDIFLPNILCRLFLWNFFKDLCMCWIISVSNIFFFIFIIIQVSPNMCVFSLKSWTDLYGRLFCQKLVSLNPPTSELKFHVNKTRQFPLYNILDPSVIYLKMLHMNWFVSHLSFPLYSRK